MSVPLNFQENARAVIQAKARAVSSRGATQAVGIGIRKQVRNWLRDLDQNRPPKHDASWPSTHYYNQAAESITAPEVAGNHVSISITQVGFRQRLLGGDISPINGKFLTVAAQGISYGVRAREFNGLKFAFAQDENGNIHAALVSTEAFQLRGSTRNRKGMGPKPPFGPDTVVYWLYRHVHQDPDQGVLPGPEYIEAAALRALRIYLKYEPRAAK